MAAQIRGDDPFIKSARVGQFDPQTVRMVFELKQNVKPQLFALAPVASFKERLVMDSIRRMQRTFRIRLGVTGRHNQAIWRNRFRLRKVVRSPEKQGARL